MKPTNRTFYKVHKSLKHFTYHNGILIQNPKLSNLPNLLFCTWYIHGLIQLSIKCKGYDRKENELKWISTGSLLTSLSISKVSNSQLVGGLERRHTPNWTKTQNKRYKKGNRFAIKITITHPNTPHSTPAHPLKLNSNLKEMSSLLLFSDLNFCPTLWAPHWGLKLSSSWQV